MALLEEVGDKGDLVAPHSTLEEPDPIENSAIAAESIVKLNKTKLGNSIVEDWLIKEQGLGGVELRRIKREKGWEESEEGRGGGGNNCGDGPQFERTGPLQPAES